MPIMIRKPSANITTVGLSLMNLANGSAASNITNTDTTTEPRKPLGWKPKATTDLATLPQSADDLLNDVTKNQDYTAAKARVEADVPAALRTRARDRGQKELDALAAARQAVKAKEDERNTRFAGFARVSPQ